jgi:hypothetical protein
MIADKIYIADDNDLFPHEYAITPYESCDNIEYIRKDALMELINRELILHGTVEEISYCDMIIDKINSL